VQFAALHMSANDAVDGSSTGTEVLVRIQLIFGTEVDRLNGQIKARV
jgi:hypothetical protein